MNIQSILSDKIKQAMIAAGADEQCDALIRQSGKPQFGDYQANGIMAAAKKLGLNPREFAQKVDFFQKLFKKASLFAVSIVIYSVRVFSSR